MPSPEEVTVNVSAADDVLFRKFRDEAVLLHLGTERYFSLNDTALRTWELLTSGETTAATAVALAGEYDVDLAVARGDVDSLVTELQRLQLITVQTDR